MKRKPPENPQIDTHEQLVERLPAILAVLNDAPDLGRLLLVNPLLVLEDLGYTLHPDLQIHIRKTLGFPPGRVRRIGELRLRLREEVRATCDAVGPFRIPASPAARAEFVFDTLGVPHQGARPEALTIEDLRPLVSRHPAVATLYRLAVLERGALQYATRGVYEEHKAGRLHHPWIKRLQFRPRS